MLALNRFVAVGLFAALTFVVGLQVADRLVLHAAFIWSEEVARFLFFWVVLLGAAMSVRARRHFVLDVGFARRPAGGVAGLVLILVPHLSVLAFSLFLLVQGIGYARAGALRTATNSNSNMALVYAAIPVFAALSAAYAGLNIRDDWRAFRGGRRVETGIPPAE